MVNVSHVSCFGGNNGAVNITVSGGTPAYSFAWSNGQNTEDLNTLTSGIYTVTVTDANGCTKTAVATVSQPMALLAVTTATDDACFGASNGDVSLTVTGGTTPYTYVWSNGTTTQNLVNVAAGTYCVTVTDAHGCSTSTCTVVLENPEIILSTSVTNVNCNGGSDGAIELSVSGGTPAYSLTLWSNGKTTQDISGLAAGTYTVTVTDFSGCTRTTSATVTQPTAIVLSATAVNVSCFGGANGSIDLTVSGGTSPYTYQWSANAGNATTQDVNGLPAGTYNVTVTDAHGCAKVLQQSHHAAWTIECLPCPKC